jgi:uncharacterized protein YbjT (DUF2867 family)
MAAEDVAAIVCSVAVGPPVNGIVEIGGPERFRFDELIRKSLRAHNDSRQVIADPHARYFGTELEGGELTPGDGARIGAIDFDTWFAAQPLRAAR